MIKKKYRLRASRHVDRAIRKGITYQAQPFRVKAFRKRQSDEPSRISVIISAKKVKTAVERNLIRRRIKSAFYPFLRETSGFDLAVFPNPADKTEFAKIQQEVEKCFDFLRSR